jgi:uncharacterized protein YecE (DUF72 family)
MQNLSLFGEPPLELKTRLGPKLRRLSQEGIHIGTSSWKYPGWLGQIYTPDRYRVRGKFSKRRFEEECLAEYAETFPIVCGDFSFYQFPAQEFWDQLFGVAPKELQFAFKVPEEMTVKWWPFHDRYGPRAGTANLSYLKADVLHEMLLEPLSAWRERVMLLMFEFGAFGRRSYESPEEYVRDLDLFLAQLPPEWRFAVEIRNPEFLTPEYLACLHSRGVAHVFNAWWKMPELSSQMAVPGAFTTSFSVTRALLRGGRSYEQAVAKFSPYRHVQEVNEGGREALRAVIRRAQEERRSAFVFVNNRFEGNAPETILAVTDA